MSDIVNLVEAFEGLTAHWSPRVIARVNDQYVKVAKVLGTLAWHKHDGEDELFHIVRGRLRMEYEHGRGVDLGPGDIHVVQRGTLHNPVAEQECWIMLVETVTTRHTGDVVTDKTRTIAEQLA